MNIRIYYFSGTGNSLFVAKQLVKRLPGAELVPIVRALVEKDFSADAGKTGFVFPTHGLTIPIPVRLFLKKIDPGTASYFFAIATRGGTVFNGFRVVEKELTKKGKTLNAGFIINHASNDPKLQIFREPTSGEIGNFDRLAEARLDGISDIIMKNGNYNGDEGSGITFTKNRIINSLLSGLISFLTHNVSPKIKKYFYSDTSCTGCGTCEKVCLSGKIRMTDRKPVWQKNITCYLCYTCLNYCPSKAVQIYSSIWMKSYTTERGRYRHPSADSSEIARQKKK